MGERRTVEARSREYQRKSKREGDERTTLERGGGKQERERREIDR